jgi:Tfp pilus assembly protein PilE
MSERGWTLIGELMKVALVLSILGFLLFLGLRK